MLALLAVLAAPAARAVEGWVTPVQGGPGGGGFEDTCPAGQYIVGFEVGAGAWLDRIAIVCAPLLAGEARFGNRTTGAFHGGPGGGPKEGHCPEGHYLGGLMFGYTRKGNDPLYVDYVDLLCRPLSGGSETQVCVETGDGCWTWRPGAAGVFSVAPMLEAFLHRCPVEQAVVGIHGRSGLYVDALGLICGPRPVVTAAAPQSSYPSKPIRALGKKKKKEEVAAVPMPSYPIIKKIGAVAAKTASVVLDVDVYEAAGGQGNSIGVLRQGSTVSLVGSCADNWCHVKGDAVPNGEGWVYSGPGYQSLRF